MDTDIDTAPQVLELRQYTLHPGRRDELIALFEREFVETQEAAGMAVLGTFRDLDDEDRFVWLRGFGDMASRPAALAAFYGGPVWKQHREQANAMMIDTDDVLLLRPTPGWQWPRTARAPVGAEAPPGVVIAAVLPWGRARPGDVDGVLAAFAAAGARGPISFTTEPASNNYPRLPVREGEAVLVVLASLAGTDAQAASLPCCDELCRRLPQAMQLMRLAPTPRSLFHP